MYTNIYKYILEIQTTFENAFVFLGLLLEVFK